MSQTQSSTRITEVGRVIIPIADQDKALAFYTEKLGFECRADIPFGGSNRWIEVAPAGSSTAIALAPPPEGTESGGRDTGISLTSHDIDGTHAELRDSGVDVDPEVMRMGGPVPPMFWFRDPEGNRLLVVQAQ